MLLAVVLPPNVTNVPYCAAHCHRYIELLYSLLLLVVCTAVELRKNLICRDM